FFGVFWALRMGSLLPPIPPLIPLAAVLAFLFEFAAGTMHKWGIAAEILILGAMAFISLTTAQSLVYLPFALYGIARHIRLFTLVPFFRAISSEPGYPEFTPLPAREKLPAEKKQ
ncbi:MAG: hypothetical protein NC192_03500, partial [Muribaculaceae bacterium]|nr:hypothetical protein [Muribaculaceae bacterium]